MRIRALITLVITSTLTARAANLPPAVQGIHCAATAEAAIARLLDGEAQRQSDGLDDVLAQNEATGFRVIGIRFDAVAQRHWAMVSACSDSAKPLRTVLLPRSAQVRLASAPSAVPGTFSPALVRTGDAVTVIRESGDSHMELHGTAVDSGSLRGEVHVRMPSFSEEAGSTAAVLRGTVIAPGVVEVLP